MKLFATQKAAVSWGVFLLAMLCLLLPSLVLAQSANGAGPFTVQNSDLSKKVFLDYLFGPLTGAGTSPLTSIVKVFNSAVLFLGGVFMAYTIIAGTMSTAHDGEMLGKKWSSLWLPIRTTLGAAAVMPVIGGGWCAGQAIVVWLASLGIGIANAMWGQYVSGAQSIQDSMYNPPEISSQVTQLFENMLLNNVCIAGMEAADGQVSAASPTAASAGLVDAVGTYTVRNTTVAGVPVLAYGTALKPSYCGMIAFPTIVPDADTGSLINGSAAPNTPYASSTGSAILNMNTIMASIVPQQNQTIQNAQATLWPLAVRIATTGGDPTTDAQLQSDVNTTIQNLTTNYTTQVKTLAQQAYSGAVNNNFLQTMTSDGWVMAGAYYMEISRAQDELNQAITTLPSASTSWDSAVTADVQNGTSSWWKFWNWGSNPPQTAIDIMKRGVQMTQNANSQITGGVASISNSNNLNGGTSHNWTDRFVSMFTARGGLVLDGDVNQNPIIMAKNLGGKLIGVAWGALIASTVLSVGGAVPIAGGAVQTVMTILAGPFTLLFSTFLVTGATMAYYLPMVPYILWIGVVLGWAILLIEAVAAAPLWAVVHMAPDADGVVGRGGQGYMLVLSLTLRPPLMIFGLVASISLMTPIGYLINSTFAGAFTMAQGSGGGSITAMAAGAVIYCGVMISVINKIFSLIHMIPDRLLRWIGGGGSELGEAAHAVEQGSAGKLAAGMQATRALGEQTANTAAGARSALANARTAREAEGGKDAQQLGNSADRVKNADEHAMDSYAAAQKAMRNGEEGAGDAMEGAAADARGASAVAVSEAVKQATITAKGKGPAADQARDFLSKFRQAEADDKASPQSGVMRRFINEQARQARDNQRPGQEIPAYNDSIIRAYENEQRADRAQMSSENYMHEQHSVDQAKKASQFDWGSYGEQGASGDDDRPSI